MGVDGVRSSPTGIDYIESKQPTRSEVAALEAAATRDQHKVELKQKDADALSGTSKGFGIAGSILSIAALCTSWCPPLAAGLGLGAAVCGGVSSGTASAASAKQDDVQGAVNNALATAERADTAAQQYKEFKALNKPSTTGTATLEAGRRAPASPAPGAPKNSTTPTRPAPAVAAAPSAPPAAATPAPKAAAPVAAPPPVKTT